MPLTQQMAQQQHHQHQILQIQRMKSKKQDPVRNPLVLVGMVFVGVLCALLLLAFIAYAPLLGASCACISYVVVFYMTTESRWWHDAQEFENRFWTMTAFLFSTALLYIHDSPLAIIGRWSPSLGMVFVIAFTSGVHFLDRMIHRQEISRKPRLNAVCFGSLTCNYVDVLMRILLLFI